MHYIILYWMVLRLRLLFLYVWTHHGG